MRTERCSELAPRPASRLTTPPGTSETPSTSARSKPGNGFSDDRIATQTFPPASAGASSATRPSSGGASGATIPTTPVGSGSENDRNGAATGFTPPSTGAILSVQPA